MGELVFVGSLCLRCVHDFLRNISKYRQKQLCVYHAIHCNGIFSELIFISISSYFILKQYRNMTLHDGAPSIVGVN